MPTLADSLRATLSQWTQPDNQVVQSPTPALASVPPEESPIAISTLLTIPLSLIHTDLHQPRRYLPDDLRDRFQHNKVDAHSTLRALFERADSGNAEAQGYLASLRDLADSIGRVGLQQPIRVSQETARDGNTLFRIVDGERRFWALVLLEFEQPSAGEQNVPVILHATAATADDIQRAQWAANLCREDIPAIDIASVVWCIREDYFARLAIDSAPYAATLGASAQPQRMSLNDMAVALTQAEVARLTGRTWAERTLYAYLSLAQKIRPKAAALARAYNLSLRQLQGVANFGEDDQVRVLLRMAGKSDAEQVESPTNKPMSAGRPTALQRGINGCILLVGVLQQISERNLARTSSDDRASLLMELEQAAAQIEKARRLVQAQSKA